MSAGTQLRSLSRDEVRNVDRRAIVEFGIPGIILMENAGRGAAELLMRRGIDGPVVICCGKGNNGGDGLEAADGIVGAAYNSFVGNGGYALAAGLQAYVDARTNYWGAASGPYNPNLNPGGAGGQVTDNVLFDPWSPVSFLASDGRIHATTSSTNCSTLSSTSSSSRSCKKSRS